MGVQPVAYRLASREAYLLKMLVNLAPLGWFGVVLLVASEGRGYTGGCNRRWYLCGSPPSSPHTGRCSPARHPRRAGTLSGLQVIVAGADMNGGYANLMPFKTGDKRAGRRKGALNKTTRILKEAILLAAEAVGQDGRGKDK